MHIVSKQTFAIYILNNNGETQTLATALSYERLRFLIGLSIVAMSHETKVPVIKLVKEETGWGLAESKWFVEQAGEQYRSCYEMPELIH